MKKQTEKKLKKLNLTLKNLKEYGIIDDSIKLIDYETIIIDPAYANIETETTKKQIFQKKNLKIKELIILKDMEHGFIILWKAL